MVFAPVRPGSPRFFVAFDPQSDVECAWFIEKPTKTDLPAQTRRSGMKRALLIIALVIVSPVFHDAQALPLKPYVGLFADANHSITCYSGSSSFDLYVWWLPSANGSVGFSQNIKRRQ
jgi:hypothetical protein